MIEYLRKRRQFANIRQINIGRGTAESDFDQ